MRHRHAFVVESEPVVALEIEDALISVGVVSIDLHTDPQVANRAVNDSPPASGFELAVLEARLAEANVVQLAQTFLGQGTAVIVTTADASVQQHFPGCTIVERPFMGDALVDAFQNALGR